MSCSCVEPEGLLIVEKVWGSIELLLKSKVSSSCLKKSWKYLLVYQHITVNRLWRDVNHYFIHSHAWSMGVICVNTYLCMSLCVYILYESIYWCILYVTVSQLVGHAPKQGYRTNSMAPWRLEYYFENGNYNALRHWTTVIKLWSVTVLFFVIWICFLFFLFGSWCNDQGKMSWVLRLHQ